MDEKKVLPEDIIKLIGDDIIVASTGIGTMISTVLTAKCVRLKKIGIKGIILNRYDERNAMHRDNKSRIEELTGVSVLACVGNGDININGNISF